MREALPVPEVDVARAHADAERLRRAGRLAAITAERLPDAAPSQWYGGAATQYDARRAELGRYVDDVRRLARQAAETLARYADAVAPQLARMRRAGDELEAALRILAVDPASSPAQARADAARGDFQAAERAYQAAVLDAVDALEAVRLAAGPLAQPASRHLEAGARRFWQDAVVGPLALGWSLTAGLVEDRDAWWGTVHALGTGLWDAATHPVQTLDEAVAGPEWRDGEWGEALGALGATAATARGRPAPDADLSTGFGRSLDPRAPKPRLQTVDEMLAAVDLEAHEHALLGHALRRHVHVDDAYLEDRLRHGTLYDDGTRGPVPRRGKASAWADQETAEEWITLALRQHELTLRTWADSSTDDVLALEIPAPAGVGRVMTLVHGQPRLSEPTLVKVVLMKDTDRVFVRTAHPDVPTPRRRSP